MDDTVTFGDIYRARRAVHGRVRRTPLVPSPSLGEHAAAPVYLKLEHQQLTGSFKLRGATNAVANLDAAQRRRGAVGFSTGNHGRGLAYACRAAGVRCVICMSRLVPRNKVQAIEALGAEVRIVGDSQDDAEREVARLVAEEEMTLVSPFDDPHVIAGQGTLGLEIVAELADVDRVVVPLSGGGLVAGVARAVKTLRPQARVVGVTMERGAAMYASQQAGRPVPVEELPSLADALGGGIGAENRYTFAMVHELVDDLVLVSEAEIAAAIHHAYWQEQQIVEGAGAVGIAALMAARIPAAGATVIVTSGGNIDMGLHHRVVSGEPVDLSAAHA